MRLKLSESPTFAKMKEEGAASKAPYAEAFGQWKNMKLVILAFLSMMCAQGAVWYTSFFYIQTFMEKFLKVDAADDQRPDDEPPRRSARCSTSCSAGCRTRSAASR
jgi:hypothetical protein